MDTHTDIQTAAMMFGAYNTRASPLRESPPPP